MASLEEALQETQSVLEEERTMAKKSVLLSAAGALLLCTIGIQAATGAGGNLWQTQVLTKLRAMALLLNLGYDVTSSYEPYTGNLRDNTYTDVNYTLRQGVPYALVGICDDDCSDLDFKLYDANYNLIDSDTQPDATPVIEVTPRWTGLFHVRVIMSRCSTSPCWYGLGEFEPAN
jgi:hypothetical protein